MTTLETAWVLPGVFGVNVDSIGGVGLALDLLTGGGMGRRLGGAGGGAGGWGDHSDG